MPIPNQGELTLYSNKPLNDNDFRNNFLQIIAWLTDGTYYLNISSLTVATLDALNNIALPSGLTITGTFSSDEIIAPKWSDISSPFVPMYIKDRNDIISMYIIPPSSIYFPNNEIGIGTTSPAYTLDVNGSINVTGKLKENTTDIVPAGSIWMWASTTAPNGWYICDGTNGTPDLRGKFIVGYNASDSDYSTIGNIGGEKTHTLTIDELPAHTHDISCTQYPGGAIIDNNSSIDWPDIRATGTTSATGGPNPHNNLPPYFVISYIMKA